MGLTGKAGFWHTRQTMTMAGLPLPTFYTEENKSGMTFPLYMTLLIFLHERKIHFCLIWYPLKPTHLANMQNHKNSPAG